MPGSLTLPGSDKRVKENVSIIESSLDKLCQLRPVTYDYKEDFRQ